MAVQIGGFNRWLNDEERFKGYRKKLVYAFLGEVHQMGMLPGVFWPAITDGTPYDVTPAGDITLTGQDPVDMVIATTEYPCGHIYPRTNYVIARIVDGDIYNKRGMYDIIVLDMDMAVKLFLSTRHTYKQEELLSPGEIKAVAPLTRVSQVKTCYSLYPETAPFEIIKIGQKGKVMDSTFNRTNELIDVNEGDYFIPSTRRFEYGDVVRAEDFDRFYCVWKFGKRHLKR